jgi:hypothetical protein
LRKLRTRAHITLVNGILRILWTLSAFAMACAIALRADAQVSRQDARCTPESTFSTVRVEDVASIEDARDDATSDDAALAVEVAAECDIRAASTISKQPTMVRRDIALTSGEAPEWTPDQPHMDLHPAFESVQAARFPEVYPQGSVRLGFHPTARTAVPIGALIALERPPRA